MSGIENFVSERDNFIFNSFGNFKPVERFQNRSDVFEFWSLDNSSSKINEFEDADFWKSYCYVMANLLRLSEHPVEM